jgi:putative tryptophan/tyrosine transport system substrate-binding protein
VAGSPDTARPNIRAFRDGLREVGYVEGENVVIDYRYDYGRGDAVPQVADFIRANVAVIVTGGGPLALAAKNATQAIPIVFVAAGDPVGFGIVESLARPGGNVTGLSLTVDADFIGKWVELLMEAAPKISHVGFIHDSNMRLSTYDERRAADRLKVRWVEVRELHDIDRAFSGMSKDRSGVIVPAQPFFSTHPREIADLASKHRLPAIYGFRLFVDDGGLLSYGLNLSDVWRQAARYIDKILKGTKPSDLPVEQPTKFELVINLKAAKALGLTIPPSLLARADQVISSGSACVPWWDFRVARSAAPRRGSSRPGVSHRSRPPGRLILGGDRRVTGRSQGDGPRGG